MWICFTMNGLQAKAHVSVITCFPQVDVAYAILLT
jgi:hypothetical protein